MNLTIPPVIAHRGASAYVPENTLLAFQKARELGCKMVEFDVVFTRCQTPVVIHDNALKRTTNGRGYCSDLTLEELKALDAGRWFSRKHAGLSVPTLVETIACLKELGLNANIEIKETGKDKAMLAAASVLAIVNEHWPDNLTEIIFSSFDEAVLAALRHLSPDINLGLLLHEWKDDWQKRAEHYGCVSLHLNQRLLTKDRVQAIKAADFYLLSYTVNRVRRAKKLFDFGVDAIFSDYPDLLC